MNLNLSGVSRGVLVRALLTIIVAINIILGYLGVNLIPVSNEEVAKLVDGAVVLITALVWMWGWWKNNSFTFNAQVADDFMHALDGPDDEPHDIEV